LQGRDKQQRGNFLQHASCSPAELVQRLAFINCKRTPSKLQQPCLPCCSACTLPQWRYQVSALMP
jgi:hypothetical protein